MNNKLLITLALTLLSINLSFAQHKKRPVPTYDVIDNNNIYVQFRNNKPHNLGITNSNVWQLFGKPLKIEKGKSEMTELMYKEYTYPFGVIDIEDGDLTNIEFEHPGLSYIFKVNGSFTRPIYVGSDALYLKNIFPYSYKQMQDNGISVQITHCDCNVSFKVKDGKILSMSFFTNES